MTAFNTGNPIGSTNPKDLYDNAQNLDVLVNSNTDVSHADRLGVQRKTWHGMEAEFDTEQAQRSSEFAQFLADSAYQDLGVYGAGIEVTRYNQVFLKDGEFYRAAASLVLPYTTTGVWVSESASFVGVGDAVLRQDLQSTGSVNGAALVGGNDGAGGSLFTTVAGFIAFLLSSLGASIVGFIQSGTGAVGRSVMDKLREHVSVKDFGIPSASALNTAVAALKVNSGGVLASDGYAISAPTGVTVDGEMSQGATLDFGHSVLSHTSGVGFTAGSYANPADQRRMKLWVKDMNVNGPGKGVAGTVALKVDETADVFTFGGWLRNAQKGLDLNGALLCDFHSLMIRDTGTAITAIKSDRFAAPNHNNFYSLKVFDNDKAINYDGPGLASVNWFGCEIEGNNLSGNSSDGVSVIKFSNAGRHNLIGCHLELNRGSIGVDYEGATNDKNLLILGSQVINEAGTELQMRRGRLTAIASYIASGTSTNDIDISPGATATLIDVEGAVSGDKSRVLSLNYGRIFFGGNGSKDEAPIFIDGPSYYLGIAQRFRADSTLIQFDKADGNRLGYISATTSYMSMLGDGVPARIGLTNAAALFIVGRAGLNVAESATDNSMSLGTASYRWKEVHTMTVRTHAVTVATLPSAATAGRGTRAFVTDANATTFASVVAGGGANAVPVYSDGTNWRIG